MSDVNDLRRLFSAHDRVARWKAEVENAKARLQLAQIEENTYHLLSQYEPVESTGLDREKLRCLLGYIEHGDMDRLKRDLEKV